MPDLRPTRYETWEHRSDRPLLVLAALFLVVFLIPLYAPDLPGWERSGLGAVNIAIWAVFAVDYLVRLWLAPQRRAFVRTHVADLLAVVVPFLRPLRLLRLVGMLGSASRRARQYSQLQTTAFIVAAVGVLLVVGGGLILDAERGAGGANITNAADALWWAATTVTTVGDGDRYPVTGAGRFVAVLLMLGGIALLGVITASVAAWFVRHFSAIEEEEARAEARLDGALAEIAARLEQIEQRLRAQEASDTLSR